MCDVIRVAGLALGLSSLWWLIVARM